MNSIGWKKYSLTIILAVLIFSLWGIIISSIYILNHTISYIPLPRSFFFTIICLGTFLWLSHEYYKKRGWEKRYISLDYNIVRKGIENILKENKINFKLTAQHIFSHDIHSFLLFEKNFKINLNKYGIRFRKHKYTIVSIGPLKDNNIQEIREIENRINKWSSSRKKIKRASRSEQVGAHQ